MKRYLPFGAVALLSACGASLSTTTTALTPSPDIRVFECANEQAKSMGFRTLTIDEDATRLVVRRPNDAIRRSDPSFFRAVDELTIEVEAQPAEGSLVRVIARTWLEFSHRRGPTFEAMEPTRVAETAAESLLNHCAPQDAQGQL